VEFKVGDKILLKEMANTPGKFNMRWDGPYTISEMKENVNYKIYADNGKKMMIVHADRMKIFHKNTPSDPIQQVIEPQSESVTKNKTPTLYNNRSHTHTAIKIQCKTTHTHARSLQSKLTIKYFQMAKLESFFILTQLIDQSSSMIINVCDCNNPIARWNNGYRNIAYCRKEKAEDPILADDRFFVKEPHMSWEGYICKAWTK
jgi:hypothetical protein